LAIESSRIKIRKLANCSEQLLIYWQAAIKIKSRRRKEGKMEKMIKKVIKLSKEDIYKIAIIINQIKEMRMKLSIMRK
jgi:hypothetical protein